MKVLASSGTKGGVGKSTFAILLAFKLAKKRKILLFDADVECPNDYLLLNQKLKKPVEFTYQEFPKIDRRKCIKCGTCSKACREHALFWVESRHPILIPELCSGCGACRIACPVSAISMVKKISGEIFVNRVTRNLTLVTGKSKVGISETGPVVLQARKFVMKKAKKEKVDYVVIDTAPGLHCNVIQALLPADKVYAVTEPTPLGAYDLEVMLVLAKMLGIKAEIVLNKANMGEKRLIEKVSKKFDVPITVEIPYDKELVKFYSSGKLLEFVEKVEWW